MANASQILLLADHIKLSLLERQRALALNLDASTSDGNISRSLESMREGIEILEKTASQQLSNPTLRAQAGDLRNQYSTLYAQFSGEPAPAATASQESSILTSPNNTSLSADFAAAQTIPNKAPASTTQQPQSSIRSTFSPAATPKSVRFRDNPASVAEAEEAELAANRAALFPYRDEPASTTNAPEELDNQQIHAYHAQVIREQDEHLDRLGESIGRQRDLSIRIGDELEEQIAMLDDVEEHVDRHQGRLDGARDRIGRFARKANDNKQISTIVVLIIILVLLIVVLK